MKRYNSTITAMEYKMSKQKRAVIIRLEKVKDGKLKLILDDLVQSNNESSKWIKDALITFKEYDINTFKELSFTDKELADFGYSIIARLYAFYKQGEL
jgi:hypothetical protein